MSLLILPPFQAQIGVPFLFCWVHCRNNASMQDAHHRLNRSGKQIAPLELIFIAPSCSSPEMLWQKSNDVGGVNKIYQQNSWCKDQCLNMKTKKHTHQKLILHRKRHLKSKKSLNVSDRVWGVGIVRSDPCIASYLVYATGWLAIQTPGPTVLGHLNLTHIQLDMESPLTVAIVTAKSHQFILAPIPHKTMSVMLLPFVYINTPQTNKHQQSSKSVIRTDVVVLKQKHLVIHCLLKPSSQNFWQKPFGALPSLLHEVLGPAVAGIVQTPWLLTL